MGNPRAREFQLKAADDAAWRRACEQPRLPIQDIHVRGIGSRRMQLIVLESFGEEVAFEIRQAEDEWRLFRSRIVESMPNLYLVGYDRMKIDPAALSTYYSRISALSLPLSLQGDVDGLDGTLSQLALFGEGSAEWRLHWWSHYPPQWQPLVEIANEMFEVFSKCEPAE